MPRIAGGDYENLHVYLGDIHNHCNLSYGHGSLANALTNARLQLDFASVTVHAVWPDIPTNDPNLNYLVDYHREGFERAKANWQGYLAAIEQANEEGRFVTFPSFEWHSIQYGDYCVYYKNPDDCPIIDAPDLPTLRERVKAVDSAAFIIPHHIGYKRGSRGINWSAFTDELSPVAEIFSFHGLSESSEGAYPYLHSMGPRHEQSTAQYGWAQGKVFGIIGSTDHHNACPGSYGYGRMGVWAESLTRDALWDAIRQRRTYALTGDRIDLRYALNGQVMGAIAPADEERWIDVSVIAGSAIDTIDVFHNNQIIHRESVFPQTLAQGRFKIQVEMGWAEQAHLFAWDVAVKVEGGVLIGLEPHLRGVGPTTESSESDEFAYHALDVDREANRVRLQTKTRRNPSLHTAATEGFVLEIDGTPHTRLIATINGREEIVALSDLATGARTFYTGGFVSPALSFHRAVPQVEYTHRFAFLHRETRNAASGHDWYTVHVRQANNQWAWSSPIWVEGTPTE